MQLFQQPFDANQVKPNEAFEALPAGWYNAKIVNSEAKPTKDNISGYLQLELEILDGEHKGRKVFDRLNLWNQGENKEKVCEIAHRQLSAYCHATGVFILQDSVQLHGIPIKIKLSVRQSEGYEPSNDVKAVKHIQDVTAPTATAPAPAFGPPAMPTAQPSPPFGQNPSLPAQPAATPAFAPPIAQQAPFGPPAQAPIAQQTPWTPPAVPGVQTAPTGGPVPPWRK